MPSYKKEFFQQIDRIAHLMEESPRKEELQEEFFAICSDIDSSLLHGRTRKKPLGYAGDFELIDWIYTRKTAPSGRGKLFDQLFHTYEAAVSVRNRKDYFIRKCQELSHQHRGRFEVLDLGCGSCRDVLETYVSSNNGHNLYFHCVDSEPQALKYARTLLSKHDLLKRVHLDTTNVFRLNTTKKYDLIWSAGLFDYLEKRIAVLLLRKIWRNLKDDGQIIFGNFSPKNPTRRGMELVGKWYLIHRTAEELIEICEETGLPYSEIEIENEANGINLFCIIKK